MKKLMRSVIASEKFALGGFMAAAAVAAALTSATWTITQDAKDAAETVAHTHKVLHAIASARADTVQIELDGQRYRISGDAEALAERDRRLRAREATLHNLDVLLAPNPAQADRLARLRALIAERMLVARKIESLRRTQGGEHAATYAASAPLRETRHEMNALLDAMHVEADLNLATRTERQLQGQKVLALSGLAATLVLTWILGTAFLYIRRQLRTAAASHRALHDSEAGLSTILMAIADGVLVCDTQGLVMRMNPAAQRLTGWTVDAARGRPLAEVLPLADHCGGVAAGHGCPSSCGVAGQDLVRVTRDGQPCVIEAHATPLQDTQGRAQGTVHVLRDVTAQREAARTIHEQNLLLAQRVVDSDTQLRIAEGHLNNILRSVPAMIAFVDKDRRYVYANDQYQQRFAPSMGSLCGLRVCDVLGDERYAVAAPRIDKVMGGTPQSYDWQPFPGVWHAISYVPKVALSGSVEGYYVLGLDISERKRATDRIEELNGELARRIRELESVTRAWKTLSAGNSAMLRATDESRLLGSMCKAITDAGGYPIAMVWYGMDDPQRSLVPMAESGYDHGMPLLRRLRTSWAQGRNESGAIGLAIRSGKTQVIGNMQTDPGCRPWRPILLGYSSCIACPLHVGETVIGALVIFAREPEAFGADEARLLTESADDLAFGIASLRTKASQQHAEEEMRRLTRFDSLTGLPNSMQFLETLSALLEGQTGAAAGGGGALLQIDIERLGEINETIGFSHGDQLICELARRLQAMVPAPGRLARLRGDEFAILLAPGDEHGAIALAVRIEAMLRAPFAVADIFLDMAVHIGIVAFDDGARSAGDLLRHMDMAANQAKKQERLYVVFDGTHAPSRPERLTMAGELRRAIENDDLRLYLQPKIEIASGRVLGAEALVRWQHKERGLVFPDAFIGLAERTGLIRNMTEWMIREAMRACADLQQRDQHLPIAVNLSAKNLRDDTLVATIRKLQSDLGVQRGMLELEITESTLMEDPHVALPMLNALRDEGVALYIDDFGTGYSSLSYLLKLPVQYIKIDKSFVRHMATNRDSAIIVKSTIDLVHDLGRKVVAEGVETRRDWDMLAALGCDVAQGYFIAKPMPASDFGDWVERFEERSDWAELRLVR